MIRLVGALLLAGGAGAAGWSAAARLTRRARTLEELAAALERMDREISFRLTPMPRLLEELGRTCPPPVGTLFARCREGLDRLGERSLGEIWRAALADAPLDLEGRGAGILDELGESLGRFGESGTRSALALAAEELAREGAAARAEGEKRGRMYRVLGLTAGAFLVILLL